MFKKIAIAALAGSILVSGVANAENFYAGAELSANSYSHKVELNHPLFGAGVFAGAKLHENFGAEAGFNMTKARTADVSPTVDAKVKFTNMYVDAMGYLPMSDDVELIGAAGLGRLKPKVEVTGVALPAEVNKAKIGLRLGAGAQMKVAENLAARVMVRHQKGNDVLKHNISAGLGLSLMF